MSVALMAHRPLRSSVDLLGPVPVASAGGPVRRKEHVLEGAQERKTALGVRGLLALLLSAFGIFGLWSGYAVVLLADLSGALGLSPVSTKDASAVGRRDRSLRCPGPLARREPRRWLNQPGCVHGITRS